MPGWYTRTCPMFNPNLNGSSSVQLPLICPLLFSDILQVNTLNLLFIVFIFLLLVLLCSSKLSYIYIYVIYIYVIYIYIYIYMLYIYIYVSSFIIVLSLCHHSYHMVKPPVFRSLHGTSEAKMAMSPPPEVSMAVHNSWLRWLSHPEKKTWLEK